MADAIPLICVTISKLRQKETIHPTKEEGKKTVNDYSFLIQQKRHRGQGTKKPVHRCQVQHSKTIYRRTLKPLSAAYING